MVDCLLFLFLKWSSISCRDVYTHFFKLPKNKTNKMTETREELEKKLIEKGFKYNSYLEIWSHAVTNEIYTLFASWFIHTDAEGGVVEMADYG